MTASVQLRALIIEDNPDDVLLLQNAIKRCGYKLDSHAVDNREALTAALTEQWDIIFSDFTLPGFSGHEALAIVRQHDLDIPFLFVSGTMGEDRAVEAMRLGAQDYFVKGSFERLAPAITRELRDRETRREHRQTEERIHHLANYDQLTGLPNRALLAERLLHFTETGMSPDGALAVFTLNLDRFRDINDHLGATMADCLLIELAGRLVDITRPEGLVARTSADEFVILAPDLPDDQAVSDLAARFLSALERPFTLARYTCTVTASLGSSLYGRDGREPDGLLNNAAIALHHAQLRAGNSYCPYTPAMRAALEEKIALDRALEQALNKQEFRIHYQPQVSLETAEIVGVEALLRWDRPGYGPVSPMTFIPLAEESGLIMLIGDWVLREVCRQARQWQADGVGPLKVAVNFSSYQFRRQNMAESIRDTLEEFGLAASCLEIEITETALMQDANAARTILSDLRELGVNLALDDFGTGYSSLSYLKRFPVDVLKIDREFVQDLPGDQDDCAIIHAVIAMAEKLGLRVVAEGVETAEQLEFLRAAGCEMVQGYFLQRPAPPEELLPLLKKRKIVF